MKTVAQVELSKDAFLWVMEHGNHVTITPWQHGSGNETATLDRKQAIALGMALIQWTDGVL